MVKPYTNKQLQRSVCSLTHLTLSRPHSHTIMLQQWTQKHSLSYKQHTHTHAGTHLLLSNCHKAFISSRCKSDQILSVFLISHIHQASVTRCLHSGNQTKQWWSVKCTRAVLVASVSVKAPVKFYREGALVTSNKRSCS